MATAAHLPELQRTRLSALARYSEVSLFLMLCSGMLALVWTGKLDPLTTVLVPVALVFKALRYWRRKPPELTARVATWLVVGYLPFYALDLLFFSRAFVSGSPNGLLYAALHASVHLTLFVLVVRLYSATRTRDLLFLSMMALACLLAAAIFTVDTAFLGFLLSFLVLGVSTFMGLEMRRSAEGAVAPPLETGTPAAQRLGRALGLTAVAMTIGAAVVASVIFLVLPRLPTGYMASLNFNPTLISGFSDNVELGRIGEIKLQTSVVMRTRMDFSPEGTPNLRWRGIVLTNFDGHRWYTESHENVATLPDADGWFSLGDRSEGSGQDNYRHVHFTVLLEPLATDAIFVLAHPVAVRGTFLPEGDRRMPEVRRGYLQLDRTQSVFNPNNNFNKISYEGLALVPKMAPEVLRRSVASYPPDILNVYMALPRLDNRIPRLAQEITARAPTPYDKANAIELYLRTRFGYTLQLPDPAPADPLAHFLFVRRAGHCEYFATAMTVMLRSLGVPARYVNGFLPGEYNDVADSYIVRGSDAHSWVEVYFPEYGWIPFDPTPSSGARPKFFLGRLAYYWDWFEMTWSEWVVNFTSVQQLHLAASAQRATREWGNWVRDFLADYRRRAVERLKILHFQVRGAIRHHPGTLLAPALLLALAVLLLLRGRSLADAIAALVARSGLRLGHGGAANPRLATIYYTRLLRMLEGRGLNKPPGQTPLEFARSVPGEQLGGMVGRLTELYQATRFGASPVDAGEMVRQLGAIQAFLRTQPRS